MFLNVSAIQSSFWISGSDASPGPAYVSLVHEYDAPMYPSKSVPTVLFRFMSMPHAVREAGSVFVYGRPVAGLIRGVQKFGRERVVGLLAADDAVVRHVFALLTRSCASSSARRRGSTTAG